MTILKKIFTLVFILHFGFSFSQEINEFEMESRIKADSVFEKIAKSQSENMPYLIFGSGNQFYIIIIDRKTHYSRIKVSLDSTDNATIESIKSLKYTDKVLKKAFDKSIYHKEFIGFQSEFYKNGYELASGATTYFVLKDKNRNRFGESFLSILVKPNPIDSEIYNYLVRELINK